MEGKELYKNINIPNKEVERLKQIEYPNFVSEKILGDFDLEGKKILDSGSGPNKKLAEFIKQKNGDYFPLDIRVQLLKEMKNSLSTNEIPFYGTVADVKNLPYKNDAFDLVHQRFVLMNTNPNDHEKNINEIMRVTKNSAILLEYDWHELNSSENPEIIENYKNLAMEIFSHFKTDPYLGEKLEKLLLQINPNFNLTINKYKREESIDNISELILSLESFSGIAKNIIKDEVLTNRLINLKDSLEKKPIKFSPPSIVTAIINK